MVSWIIESDKLLLTWTLFMFSLVKLRCTEIRLASKVVCLLLTFVFLSSEQLHFVQYIVFLQPVSVILCEDNIQQTGY